MRSSEVVYESEGVTDVSGVLYWDALCRDLYVKI